MEKKLQHHIRCKEGDVGRYVILTGDPGRCIKIAQRLDSYEKVAENREYVIFTGLLDNEKVSVASTGIGGPSASIAMEELAKIGSDTFIRVGTSGGLQPGIQPGHLVVATGAIRTEGTSRAYLPIEFPAVSDLEVVNALVMAAKELGYHYHVGVVRCRDAYYEESDPDTRPLSKDSIERTEMLRRAGVIASEMESAPLFVLGSVLHVRVGVVLLIAGNYVRLRMRLETTRFDDPTIAIQTGVNAMRILIKQDKEG